jgi:dTDP-4-amino-4,6-dideoxygalactose transaminase
MSKINNVPLLDLKAQYAQIKAEVEPAIFEVMESQYFILGPKVKQFEENMAKYCGTKYALGVSSGTDALLIALMAIGIEAGDEIITTTYSFFATAGAIARMGAKPVFADIDPVSFNIDPHKIEALITKKTKAIIPVHLYGQLADMTPIMTVAEKYNLIVIEDAAQAIGSRYSDGRKAGEFGDMGCFSFFPSKNLGGFGDGGLVTTNNENLYNTLVYMRNHGSHPKYYHKMIGGNFRLDAIQAVVLDVKLKYLDGWTEGRKANAEFYCEGLNSRKLTKYVQPPATLEGYHHIYNQFIIRVEKRDELLAFLKSKNIGCEIYYPVSFHEQECFSHLGYQKGDFPNAEQAESETIAIPIYPELTEYQKNYVLDAIAEFYNT